MKNKICKSLTKDLIPYLYLLQDGFFEVNEYVHALI